MKRKEFLMRTFNTLGGIVLIPTFGGCDGKSDHHELEDGSCTLTDRETAGPFPTKEPASFALENIVSDRQGTALNVEITVLNKNQQCEPLSGALVDIWHCDAAGNYSQYGSQSSVSFLRGRQATNDKGQAGFQTIYPGWYSGRAIHIHVHIFSASGKSLLITQIAFPEDINTAVLAQGAYASKGQADTCNARDGIFRDSLATEMATVTGTVTTGYKLSHSIVVNA